MADEPKWLCHPQTRKIASVGNPVVPENSIWPHWRAEAFNRDLPDGEIHLLDAVILPWTRGTTRSVVLFSRSWPNIPSDYSTCRVCNVGAAVTTSRKQLLPAPEEPTKMALGEPIIIGAVL